MSSEEQKQKGNATFMSDHFILISGATSSLGRNIALELASSGAQLVLLDKERKSLHNVAKEIRAKFKVAVFVYPLNLHSTDKLAYSKMVKKIEKKVPRLDTVILNARYTGYDINLLSYSFQLWREVIQVNLNANFMLTQSLVPLLLKAKKPQLIFNIHNDIIAESGWSAYMVAQNGLKTLMQACAAEFSRSHLLVFGIPLASILDPNNMPANQENITLSKRNLQKIAAIFPLLLANQKRSHHGKSINLHQWLMVYRTN